MTPSVIDDLDFYFGFTEKVFEFQRIGVRRLVMQQDSLDLIANKHVSRRRVFPFRFRGSCRLEPCLDGEVAPEIVQSAGGFDEGVLKARLEVAINVTDATEDLDSGATVLEAHP